MPIPQALEAGLLRGWTEKLSQDLFDELVKSVSDLSNGRETLDGVIHVSDGRDVAVLGIGESGVTERTDCGEIRDRMGATNAGWGRPRNPATKDSVAMPNSLGRKTATAG